jgi:hypothetical protein
VKTTPERSLRELADAAFLAASYDVIKIAEATGTPILIWEDGIAKKLNPEEARLRLAEASKKAALLVPNTKEESAAPSS